MALPVEKVTVKESGSRIRLSADVLTPLNWKEFGDDFECWGIFRYPGELLCAPKALKSENGQHPFGPALTVLEDLSPPEAVSSLVDIPSALTLTALTRVFAFTASWPSENKKQLDLKLRVPVTSQLGWNRGSETTVHCIPWTRILILLSDSRFQEVQRQDFTGGSLQL